MEEGETTLECLPVTQPLPPAPSIGWCESRPPNPVGTSLTPLGAAAAAGTFGPAPLLQPGEAEQGTGTGWAGTRPGSTRADVKAPRRRLRKQGRRCEKQARHSSPGSHIP